MTVRDPTLRRFWYPVPGHLGIGVTAHARPEADALARAAASKHGWMLDAGGCVEDVDMRSLDSRHVLPNVGPVVFPGVWFPRLNL